MLYTKYDGGIMNSKAIVVGIAGGTGSGKTSVAHYILNYLKNNKINPILLEQDSYYKKMSHMSFDERVKLNYDHPDLIDFSLLIEHIKDLSSGKSIKKPIYDFKIYDRKDDVEVVQASKLIMVEGILLFTLKELRDLFDAKVFVDTDDDERLLRRIERDMKERGRTFDSIRDQYRKTVKPMHLEFVEPSKRYADVIIPRGGDNKVGIKMVATRLKHLLSELK